MRYVRIFLIHFQEAFYERGRSFVWFLVPLVNALLILAFWIGALKDKGSLGNDWTLSSIASYYFLLIIAGSFLEMHIEEDVAKHDIQEGGLARYLLRPFSYFWFQFFHEIPWRIIQGFYALMVFLLFAFFFGNFVKLTTSPVVIFLSIIIIILALFLSFVFKMIFGLSAFWITDYTGAQQIVDIVLLVLGGFVIPLEFFPDVLKGVAYILPFSYMTYFPIIALQGKLATFELFRVIAVQSLWLGGFYFTYRFLWDRGVKEFTAVGQ